MTWEPAVVTGHLATRTTFDDPEDSFRILRAWRDAAPDLFPERLDSQEPIRERIDPDHIELSRARQFGPVWYATRSRPKVQVHLARAVRSHGDLSIYGMDRHDVQAFSASIAHLVDAWARVLAPEYGMVHVLTEPERLEAMSPWRADLDGNDEIGQVTWGFTVELRRGLPTLYWRNLFGRPYVELFGRDRLASLPVYSIVETTWGFAVQLTPLPPTDADYPTFREIRERAIDHLGRDAFLSDATPHRATRLPDFGVFPEPVRPQPAKRVPPG